MLLFGPAWWASAQKSIRQVDFKNFTYPMSGPKLGHDRLLWLDASAKGHVKLVNGSNGYGYEDGFRGPGLTLQTVTFADVTGDDQEEAIVVLRWDSGGTQNTYYIYVYSFDNGKPKLLAYFHSGSRAYSGLYGVYGESGRLVVELNDPKKAEGDCCSSAFVRTRYRWADGKFKMVGKREYGAVEISGPPSL
jgi:hypothetical protein